MSTSTQKQEAWFRLYWADVHEFKKTDLCHVAGVPETVGLLFWDELSPQERALVRAEIIRRVCNCVVEQKGAA